MLGRLLLSKDETVDNVDFRNQSWKNETGLMNGFQMTRTGYRQTEHPEDSE